MFIGHLYFFFFCMNSQSHIKGGKLTPMELLRFQDTGDPQYFHNMNSVVTAM